MPIQKGCTLCGGNDHERSSCSWSGAPDGEEAFKAAFEKACEEWVSGIVVQLGRMMWQAGAAWQRAQSAPALADETTDLHQMAFELGGTEDGDYLLDFDDLEAVIQAARRISGGFLLIHEDDLIESDNYGVPGSNFYTCKLCHAESGAGLLNKGIPHDAGCPLAASPAPEVQQGELGDAYQGAREDLAIWKRRALEAEEKLRQCDQGFTVLASLHTHYDGRQRVQLPGMVYDQDAGWGAHVEHLVSLSQARSAVFQAVVRCEQKGAFKACMECGYQDGHDAICKYHESHRAERQEPAPDADQLALDAATDIVALMYGPTPAGGSVQLKAQVQCRVLDAIKAATRPDHSGDAAELVEALEQIVQQYPNPDINHVDYRAHACRHAETALAAYRAQPSAGGE